MGRQAYLARLALGRSAFGAPTRDEDGDFLLGPYARERDNFPSRQQWDDRGHPQNIEANLRARRFRKAQNEVLEACGVIVRRDAETKSKWQKMSFDAKIRLVTNENRTGYILRGIDRFAGLLTSWWAMCLRRRILTFGLQNTSLIGLATSDIRSVGALAFVGAGLPVFCLGSVFKLFRYYSSQPDVEEIVNYVRTPKPSAEIDLSGEVLDEWEKLLRDWRIRPVFLCAELPIDLFSVLQTTYLTNLPGTLSLWKFIPSPIVWTRDLFVSRNLLAQSISHQLLRIARSPFLIGVVRDCIQVQLGFRIYALLRQISLKPNRPDKVSVEACDSDHTIDETSISGIGRKWSASNHRYFGPTTFYRAFSLAFPTLSRVIGSVFGQSLHSYKDQINPDNRDVRQYILGRYRYALMNASPLPPEDSSQDISLRVDAILTSLDRLGIDVDEDLVDVDCWVEGIANDDAGSVETLDTDELLERAETSHRAIGDDPEPPRLVFREEAEPNPLVIAHGALRVDDGDVTTAARASTQQGNSGQGSFGGTVPLDALLREAEPASNVRWPEMDLTLTPSISASAPQPVRRPTEVDRSDITQVFAAFHDEHQRHNKVARRKREARQFRVSFLSTHAADSMAWHASAVIANLLMVPFDTLLLRILAKWYLDASFGPNRTPLDGATLYGIVSPAIQAGTNENEAFGVFHHVGLIVLTSCLEGFSRMVVWYAGTSLASWYGSKYGWNRF